MAKVLRLLFAAALLAVVADGCGGTAQPQRSAFHGVPPALAQAWEGQASAIARAASVDDGCRASRLADSLRTDVIAKEHKLPPRLRSPLLIGVNSLADRITCTPVVTPQPPTRKSPPAPKAPKPKPGPKPGPKPKPPKPHGPPGHDRGHDR